MKHDLLGAHFILVMLAKTFVFYRVTSKFFGATFNQKVPWTCKNTRLFDHFVNEHEVCLSNKYETFLSNKHEKFLNNQHKIFLSNKHETFLSNTHEAFLRDEHESFWIF